jgi:hypothetical protein
MGLPRLSSAVCCCCVLLLSPSVSPAAAYDQAVLALMSDPEVTEDIFSVMSAGVRLFFLGGGRLG